VTVEENARSLVISAFQARLRPLDESGLGLVLSQWLGIPRVNVVIRADGEYVIHCFKPADAKLVVDWFGGRQSKSDVRGHIVDLTL